MVEPLETQFQRLGGFRGGRSQCKTASVFLLYSIATTAALRLAKL